MTTTSHGPFHLTPTRKLVTYGILAIWTLIVLFPLYWVLITAFKLPADVDVPKYIPFVDFQPTLAAWKELLVDPTSGNIVARPYLNTLVVGTTSAFFSLLFGSLAAYALLRFHYRLKLGYIGTFITCLLLGIVLLAVGLPWPVALAVALSVFVLIAQTLGRRFRRSVGNSDISFWLVSQRMLPPIAVIIPIYILFQALHMLDSDITLIISYAGVNLPLAVWFMRDYLEGIPIELEESAFIDGASRYQVLMRIILPLATPGLVATYLIILVFAWNEYTLALFLSEANAQTMPVLVVAQNATRGPQWWNISVLVLLMIGPIILVAIFLERYIAKGLLVGAVKS